MGFFDFLKPSFIPSFKPPGGFDPAGVFGGSGGGTNGQTPVAVGNGLGALGMQGNVNAGEPGRPGGMVGTMQAAANAQGPNPYAQRIARLTAMGYDGPMPGSQELMDARAAGQHPIWDWRREHLSHPGLPNGGQGFQMPQMPWQAGFQWPGPGQGQGQGPNMHPNGGMFGGQQGGAAGEAPHQGFPLPQMPQIPGYPTPPVSQGIAVGEPNGLSGLARRRPPMLVGR